jgi:hypothetical protein
VIDCNHEEGVVNKREIESMHILDLPEGLVIAIER